MHTKDAWWNSTCPRSGRNHRAEDERCEGDRDERPHPLTLLLVSGRGDAEHPPPDHQQAELEDTCRERRHPEEREAEALLEEERGGLLVQEVAVERQASTVPLRGRRERASILEVRPDEVRRQQDELQDHRCERQQAPLCHRRPRSYSNRAGVTTPSTAAQATKRAKNSRM
ncbi:MAG: hypothetical protein IPJ34_29425 [Myxococcales bacterium]|nr:hypothetical protein [Myxococcales bacterium]